MSRSPAPRSPEHVTVPGIRARKHEAAPVVCLTAYDWPTARIADAGGVDLILVGDSLANVQLGLDSTLPVGMDEMLAAVRAVRRGVERALLVADMPFGSYQASENTAVENAVRFLRAGAEAVKLEGGATRASLVERLARNGIPVLGHIGLTPQSVHAFGGYRVQGRTDADARRLLEDAAALERAGAFAVVLEGVPRELAAELTSRVEIPTIGIGAGPECDGQILVISDLLGLTPGAKPRFVRSYLDLHGLAVDAVRTWGSDIRSGDFPSAAESYGSPRPHSATSGKVRS